MTADRTWAGKGDREALFVRIPTAQARALARIAAETGRPKQEVVADLLSRSIGDQGRSIAADGGLTLGHHTFRSYEPDVLTLDEVAELLGVEPALIEGLADRGELPGRRIGEAWRFARSAVLEWLGHGNEGEPAQSDR
jgi:excisionase family DNA binding protein